MSELKRPDLSNLPGEVVAYIEALEERLGERPGKPVETQAARTAQADADADATTMVVSISREGNAKRTPLAFYGAQRRGGMGVFDIELSENDVPAALVVAEESDTLLLFSNEGRAFRLPADVLPRTEVRSRGRQLTQRLPLHDGEQIVAALRADAGTHVVLASKRGWVRRIRSSFLGRTLIPGMVFHDVAEGGELAAACWSDGHSELFMVTKQGKAIRFLESQVSDRRGCLGLRVAPDDTVVAVAAVQEDSSVFLIGADGLGTRRLMSGFRANKAPGAAGKIAMKTDHLVGAVTVGDEQDLLLISAQSKIIRFQADEVPPKEGIVQGVSCMTLRRDETAAVTVTAR